MHASDALISPGVGLAAGAIAVGLIGVASKKIKKIERSDLVPLMGVMGAFVFAAQMINFTIPGTGSSGHLIGGVLLSAILGPWCGFITLSSIIIVQCLVFADGGLMALGCNILNMAATSCLIAYPLVYKPIVGQSLNSGRILTGSILASILALQIGALGVTVETELSGVTALPMVTFLKFMLPIHLAIGLGEGLVTGALIVFLATYRPIILTENRETVTSPSKKSLKPVFWIFGLSTLILAGGFSILASENPDGLEWSIEKVSGLAELPTEAPPTAFMPDYNSSFAGIIGTLIVMAGLWCVTGLFFNIMKKNRTGK